MRHEDLRAATRLAAEKKVNKLETRLTPGEKSNRKRMAQVATVYSVAPWERSPADVLHEVRPDDVEKRRPTPHGKRVWAPGSPVNGGHGPHVPPTSLPRLEPSRSD